MGDVVNLLGLLVGFAGALLLAIFRLPPLEVTSDGRRVAAEEPTPEERARNLRRYWRNAAATRAGLICLCVGFALQALAYFFWNSSGSGDTVGAAVRFIGTRLH
jgi:hypothetical protein